MRNNKVTNVLQLFRNPHSAFQSLLFPLPPESLELDLDSLLVSGFESLFEPEPFCDFVSASAAFLYESLR